jgi:hypothetical protein
MPVNLYRNSLSRAEPLASRRYATHFSFDGVVSWAAFDCPIDHTIKEA